jgi:hypothetical protein
VFERFCSECLLEFAQLTPHTFLSVFSGDHFQWPIYYEALAHGGRFLSKLPIIAPQNKQVEVGMLIHTANKFLVASGGFQFDVDTGEIWFTTAIDVADGALTVCQLFVLYDQHRLVDFWIERVLQTVLRGSPQAHANAQYSLAQSIPSRPRASWRELLRDVAVDRN